MYIVYARRSPRAWWRRNKAYHHSGDAQRAAQVLRDNGDEAVACKAPAFIFDQFCVPLKLPPKYDMAHYLETDEERWRILFQQTYPILYTPGYEPRFYQAQDMGALWDAVNSNRPIGYSVRFGRVIFVRIEKSWAWAIEYRLQEPIRPLFYSMYEFIDVIRAAEETEKENVR